MSDGQDQTAIFDRLGRLEGLIVGLQTSISQGQGQVAGFMARVERLEARQVELERTMVTRDDLAGMTRKVDADLTALMAKVDGLVTSDASRRGGTAVASWSIANLAPWLAVLVAILALVGVGVNREALQRQQEQRQEQGR